MMETDKSIRLRKWRVLWFYVAILTGTHVGSIYGLYLLITKAKWLTCVSAYLMYISANIGVTAGAHRLWAHKSYKAKLPMKIILLMFFTAADQGTLYDWVCYHRMHHKFCDTDADPHNSKRGFFFSHVGWVLVEKHPDFITEVCNINLNDIEADDLLRFQHKYHFLLVLILRYIIPTNVPRLWNEDPWTAFLIISVFSNTCALHSIFLINSAAHMWGTKPYNKNILPTETKTVSLLACGEGFHNYHHTFPWDYRAAELGGYVFNTSRLFIDIMAKIGWAYNLKTVSEDIIAKRVKRTGDGSHPMWVFSGSP